MALNYEKLQKLPALQGFAPEELDAFFSIANRIVTKPGDSVIKSGDKADCFFLIAEGGLEVAIEQNGKMMAVAQLGPGQLVGEMPLIYNQPVRQADVISFEEAKLLRFDYTAYEELGKLHPALVKKFRSNIGKIVASRVWATMPGSQTAGSATPQKPGQAGSAAGQPAKAIGSSGSNRDAMRKATMFQGFAEEELTSMLNISQPYPVEKNQTVCSAGDPANSFFLITKGQVEVQISKNGKNFPLARLGPGQVFGEMALIYNQPNRSATVVAVDTSHLIMFPFEDYNRLIVGEPAIGKKLRNNLGRVAASRAWSLPEADEAKSLQNRWDS